MTVLPIVTAPDPRLKRKCESVERVDDAIRTLMDDMLDSMYAANGIGLAAPQIGENKRVIVVDVSGPKEDPRPLRMANPEIIFQAQEESVHEEGCLSLPDQYAEVVRPVSIRVRYIDEENEIRELDADGMLSVCIQHEIDHLDGVLFVDHISTIKRKMILRKLTKIKKLSEAMV